MNAPRVSAQLLNVGGAAVCFGSLAVPWQRNAISGSRSGVDVVMESANDGRWLRLVLISVVAATAAGLIRFRVLSIGALCAAGIFLLLLRQETHSQYTRAFGQDSLGRVIEPEAASRVGLGFYVAVGAVLVMSFAVLVLAKPKRRGPEGVKLRSVGA
jgi:hypothetical protein